MKVNSKNRFHQPAYPNAASHRYIVGKILDTITAIASGVGFMSILLFFFLI